MWLMEYLQQMFDINSGRFELDDETTYVNSKDFESHCTSSAENPSTRRMVPLAARFNINVGGTLVMQSVVKAK